MPGDALSVGGAATNKGIWFQALWVVLQAAAHQLGISVSSASHGADESLRLVLEPIGGDVRIEFQGSKRIIQLKVKDQGTWALKDLITEVLPDLYRAVDINDDKASYEFVTEGRQGQWSAALTFFNGLGGRLHGRQFADAYVQLRANVEVPFAYQLGEFWQVGDDTEKGLFDRIVAVLRGPEPEGKSDNREPLDLVRRKAWHLLTRLRFSGGHSPESVRRDVIQVLMRVVPQREKLPELCDAMGGWICARSSTNNASVTPAELFQAHDLDRATPIGDLLVLRRLCRERLTRQLHALGYRPEWDVRRSADPSGTCTSTAITAVTGGSGEGKSWRVYAAADAAETAATILIESSGTITGDLQYAAEVLWQEVLGHDVAKPVASIADHLTQLFGVARGDPWLTICIDRVESVRAANDLLLQPLEQWGVRVVVGCEPHVAALLEQQATAEPSRVLVSRVGKFSTDELHRYLRLRLGEGYARLPADIRDVLRHPQLAALYCELVATEPPCYPKPNKEAWHPQSEYELVRRFWDRLDGPQVPLNSTDSWRIMALAGDLLDGRPYPWTPDRLDAARLDDDARGRLMRLGWLRCTARRERFEVPHDRLLGHAVARSLVQRCTNQDLTAGEVANALASATSGPHAWRLGYLLMDWFDLATRHDQLRKLAQDVLHLYGEKVERHVRADLHQRLMPTLGPAAVPLLLHCLRNLAEHAPLYEVVPAIEGIADALPERDLGTTRDAVLSLLTDDRPKVRRAGLRLVRLRPVPEALDPVWRLHHQMRADPTPYAEERAVSHTLYQESFDALRAATRIYPEWLDQAILRADPAVDAVADLAYLVANLNDGGALWRRRKADLLSKVPSGKARSLATNIGLWRDSDETHRLEEWARRASADDHDFAAPAAVLAMARINPTRAVALLPQMSPHTLYFCRGWFLPRLFFTEGDATRDALFSVISRADDPLHEAIFYQGNANDMDVRTLDLLLDVLERRLAEALAPRQEGERAVHLVAELNLLAEVGRAELLDVFTRRSGTSLEDRLVEFLVKVVGPQRGKWVTGSERVPALTILLRINGDGFSRVLRAYLADPDIWAKLDAVQWAKWYAGAELLADIAEAASANYSTDVDPIVLRFEAARTLAGHGHVTGLSKVIRVIGQMPLGLPDWLPEPSANHTTLPAETVEGVRIATGNVLRGSILMLGLARSEGAVDEALRLLRTTSDRETRIAAIAAIGLAGRQDEQAVLAVADCLANKDLQFAAVCALRSIGGQRAHAELAASLDHTWDAGLAMALAADSVHRKEIVTRLAARVSQCVAPKPPPGIGTDTLRTVLANAPDELLAEIIRVCETSVHDWLREAVLMREGAFWVTGSKRDAIRGLSFVDPDAARVAAAVALENRDSHDRTLYPMILYRLDATAARQKFLDLAGDESDRAVLASMAYALSPAVDAEWLSSHLQVPQSRTRIAACRLATGPCGDVPTVEVILRSTTDDPSAEVADAAVEALRHVHRQRQAGAAIANLPAGAPQSRVAAIVQGAIAVGDAGFDRGPWPKWTKLLFESARIRRFPSVLHAAEARLKESRDKAADKAKHDAKQR